MGEEAKTDNSSLDGRAGKERRKSFWLDEDTFIGVWAEHNNKHKGMEKKDEQFKYRAYYEFCWNLFCALTDTKLAKKYQNGNAPNRILNYPERLGALTDKDATLEDKKSVVFSFMYERCIRKAEALLPGLQAINPKITAPYGQEWHNWMWSEERKWAGRASQFDI